LTALKTPAFLFIIGGVSLLTFTVNTL
jgi:hypothetical protein